MFENRDSGHCMEIDWETEAIKIAACDLENKAQRFKVPKPTEDFYAFPV